MYMCSEGGGGGGGGGGTMLIQIPGADLSKQNCTSLLSGLSLSRVV